MNRINLIFAAFAICLFTSCAENNDSDLGLLIGNLLTDDIRPTCDATAKSPYTGVITPETGHYMPMMLHPVAGHEVWFQTENGCALYDLASGTKRQEISSIVAQKTMGYSHGEFYHQGVMIVASNAGVVALKGKEGTLLWEKKAEDCTLSGGDVTGWNDRYFVMGHGMDKDKKMYGAIYSGTISGGGDDLKMEIIPNFSGIYNSWAGYGRISSMAAYTGRDGGHYLFVVYLEPVNYNHIKYYAGLYNHDRSAWEYDHIALDSAPENLGSNGLNLSPDGIAMIGLDGKLLEVDVMTGRNLRSKTGAYSNRFWMNNQYVVSETNANEIAVFDRKTLQIVHKQHLSGTPYIDFEADRLFAINYDKAMVYELSTGRLLKNISPPCSNDLPTTFEGSLAWWKGDAGRLQLAIPAKGKVYRYEL